MVRGKNQPKQMNFSENKENFFSTGWTSKDCCSALSAGYKTLQVQHRTTDKQQSAEGTGCTVKSLFNSVFAKPQVYCD